MDDQTETPIPRHDESIAHHADLLAWYERTTGRTAEVVRVDGVTRFRRNSLYRWIVDRDAILTPMCAAFQRGKFSLAEYAEFYAGIGYSLSGFGEIFGEYIWPQT